MPAATTSTGSVASVGLAALLAGAVGDVAADVMMVVLGAIAGAQIALSASQAKGILQSLKYFSMSVFTSLTIAWALASIVAALHPAFASPYTPTVIALIIGTQSMRLHVIASKITGKFEKKIEG